jgi:hypothetical protein
VGRVRPGQVLLAEGAEQTKAVLMMIVLNIQQWVELILESKRGLEREEGSVLNHLPGRSR